MATSSNSFCNILSMIHPSYCFPETSNYWKVSRPFFFHLQQTYYPSTSHFSPHRKKPSRFPLLSRQDWPFPSELSRISSGRSVRMTLPSFYFRFSDAHRGKSPFTRTNEVKGRQLIRRLSDSKWKRQLLSPLSQRYLIARPPGQSLCVKFPLC